MTSVSDSKRAGAVNLLWIDEWEWWFVGNLSSFPPLSRSSKHKGSTSTFRHLLHITQKCKEWFTLTHCNEKSFRKSENSQIQSSILIRHPVIELHFIIFLNIIGLLFLDIFLWESATICVCLHKNLNLSVCWRGNRTQLSPVERLCLGH